MNKKWLGIFAAFAVVLTIAWLIAYHGGAKVALDDSAVQRTRDEVSDVHFIDDEAIALSGEIHNSAAVVAEATAAHALVNEQRAANGLPALAWDNGLTQAAQVRAQECQQVFSHTRPDGTDWWTVNSDIMFGENLAKGYDAAADVVDAWMNSTTHRAAILNSEFTTAGIGIYLGSDGTWYWAENFGMD